MGGQGGREGDKDQVTKEHLLPRGTVVADEGKYSTTAPVCNIDGDFMVMVSGEFSGYDGYYGHDGGMPPVHWGIHMVWARLSPSLGTGMVCL